MLTGALNLSKEAAHGRPALVNRQRPSSSTLLVRGQLANSGQLKAPGLYAALSQVRDSPCTAPWAACKPFSSTPASLCSFPHLVSTRSLTTNVPPNHIKTFKDQGASSPPRLRGRACFIHFHAWGSPWPLLFIETSPIISLMFGVKGETRKRKKTLAKTL